jgi:hypothetical protein
MITMLFAPVVRLNDVLRYKGITKQSRVVETAALRLKIVTMFFMIFLDLIIVHALNQEGYPISLTQVVQI